MSDVFYSADTGPTANLSDFAAGSRIVICEGTTRPDSLETPEMRGHLTPAEAGRLARDASANTLVLTHLWAEDDPFRAQLEAAEAFDAPVILATPGTRITVS